MSKTTIFSHEEYMEVMTQTFNEITKLGKLKGGEYSGDIDRLLNFRRAADKFRVPPELTLMIYAGKHWDALAQYTDDLVHSVTRERMEDIAGRIDDLILYMILFKCMRIEHVREANTAPPKG